MNNFKLGLLVVVVVAAVVIGLTYQKPVEVATNDVDAPRTASQQMSFFITSQNPGKGGDLGGLAGADAYCATLAEAAGVKGKEWVAYLSTADSDEVMNARDRIGDGPWFNFNGVQIAANVDELHGTNNLNKETALTEKGERVSGRGDTPNEHDILTGSDMLGNYFATSTDSTCSNWTSSTEGSAMVGHHDRIGINDSAPMKSWVASHLSRGCSLDALKSTGGAGKYYCFAK